ncbi:MAG: hypothetical protein M3Q48_07535 [Actinomycetota bacterium]|nr:hypothetical protein [Actinomycetota bacterium]
MSTGGADGSVTVVDATGEGTADATVVAGNSVAVGAWTLVSRVTGVGKVVAIAAVLGPTYLGNTYQATNLLPNVVYFGFLAGSLFASLLVPPLVAHLDRNDFRGAQRVAGGFLGVALIAFALLTAVVVAAGPLVMRVLAAGVEDPEVAEAQRRIGAPLLAMLMPQVVLYGIAGTAGAVLNARGRFALASAAPALENVGIMITLTANAILFGTGIDVEGVGASQLLLLGMGTTGAVALHAGAVWLGARRAGITLVPRGGWRDPEVRAVLRRAVPSLGHGGLGAFASFAVLVVANRVPGGVVAFQMALNFYALPVAVGANSVALALLPQLSRSHNAGNGQRFRSQLVEGLSLAFFLSIPVALAYVVLAWPLARAVSFGEMATPQGVRLIAVSLAAIGLGVLGETAFRVATNACYAQRDVRTPLVGMVIRGAVCLAGMMLALLGHGVAVLLVVGLAYTMADLTGAAYVWRKLAARLPTATGFGPPFARCLAAAGLMLVPASAVAAGVPTLLDGRLRHVLAAVLASAVGAAVYLGLQRLWGSPELSSLLAGVRLSGAQGGAPAAEPGSGR